MIGLENSNSLHNFLAPILPHAEAHAVDHATEWVLVGLAVAAFLVGGGLAWLLYSTRPDLPGRIRARAAGLHRAVVNKYWVDELYDAAVVRPLVVISDRVLFRAIDAGTIDGIANGSAALVRGLAARGLKYAQSGLAQSYLFFMIAGTLAILGWMLV
jgi:NADH-quinone oxidoreductase subunit L